MAIDQARDRRPLTPPRVDREDTPRERARKAAMLSGLVCPGIGQAYNKEYIKAALFLTGVLTGLGYFFFALWKGFSTYFAMMDLISDPTAMSMPASPSLSGWLFRGVLIGGLPALILWGVSAWDAHRVALRRGGLVVGRSG